MKKLAILFLFIFTAFSSYGQNLDIEQLLSSYTANELSQTILDGNIPVAIGVLHDAFIENPAPLAKAVIEEQEILNIFIAYAASEQPAEREEYETKLFETIY